MKDAMAVLDSKDATDAALTRLRLDYDANSARPAKIQKRADVEALANRATRGEAIYPLKEITVDIPQQTAVSSGW